MITSDQSSFTRAEPMGDEALAALRSLAQAGITPTPTATLSLLARLDATHDNSTILARDLDDALSRLRRAEKDRDAKAEVLDGLPALFDALAKNMDQLADTHPPGLYGRGFMVGKADGFRQAAHLARAAVSAARQALITLPTETSTEERADQ